MNTCDSQRVKRFLYRLHNWNAKNTLKVLGDDDFEGLNVATSYSSPTIHEQFKSA